MKRISAAVRTVLGLGLVVVAVGAWIAADRSETSATASPVMATDPGSFRTLRLFQDLPGGLGLQTNLCLSPPLLSPNEHDPAMVVHVEHRLYAGEEGERHLQAQMHLHRVVSPVGAEPIEARLSLPAPADGSALSVVLLVEPAPNLCWQQAADDQTFLNVLALLEPGSDTAGR
ncbi:MAG: hypothetical protein AB1726_07740 [Planctomycetota bacterium]